LTFWHQVPITGNSFANDKWRALATRWCLKMFHGGFFVSVYHLIISGYSRLLSWLPGHKYKKVYFYNISVWNCITCKFYFFMFYYKSFKLNLKWIFSWIEIWMKRICWPPTPSNDVYFYFCRFCSYFKKVFSWFLFLLCISSHFYRKGDLLFFFIHHNCFFQENKG
jgi:hypothetical protein